MNTKYKIGVPKEIYHGETRVALVPKMAAQLKKDGYEVLIEMNAGALAFFSDTEYEEAGAEVIQDVQHLYSEANVILKVQPPQKNVATGKHESEMMKQGSTYIGFLDPMRKLDIIQQMNKRSLTSFAMEYIPRIARAQSMDALSSMASIAGYRAVLVAANHLGKFFPFMMTAAGTIPPAKVLVLGAGVAGLQAVATARRLGASAEAFDVRPAAREQVESLGAQFIGLEFIKDAETKGGYAKELSDELLKREREVIGLRLAHNDVVIAAAQTFGKKAPILITGEMVKRMRKGSIIIDLAVEQGGNCELTEAGKDVVKHDIRICGAVNLPSTLPIDASNMYSRNITNFFRNLYKANDKTINFEDDITKSTCITHKGEVVNEMVRQALKKG